MKARLSAVLSASLLVAGCFDAGIEEASTRITSLQASGAACGTDDRGTMRCWGGFSPELARTDLKVPVLVPAGGNPALVRIEDRGWLGCGLDRDGRAWCWGDNSYGQVGAGHASWREPVTTVATDLRFTAIGVTNSTSCGLATDGQLYCWGDPSGAGRPGAPTDLCSTWPGYTYDCLLTPQPVLSSERFTEFSASNDYLCGLAGGVAHCWNSMLAPSPIGGLPPLVHVQAGGDRACGMSADGRVFCWGWYEDEADEIEMPDGVRPIELSVGRSHACVRDQQGNAWCWGAGMAVGTLTDGGSRTPARAVGGLRFSELAAGEGFTCGIAPDGAWCWGNHVGDGGGVPRPVPTKVGGQ